MTQYPKITEYRAFLSALKNMWTVNFQMFKLVLEKAEEPRTSLPTSAGSSKKQESSKKSSISALLTMPKLLTVWITINWKILKKIGIPDHLTHVLRTYMQVRKQQLELDMGHQTGSKEEKEYVKAVYCHSAYLTYMQSTSLKCWAGRSTSWKQDCWEKYQ